MAPPFPRHLAATGALLDKKTLVARVVQCSTLRGSAFHGALSLSAREGFAVRSPILPCATRPALSTATSAEVYQEPALRGKVIHGMTTVEGRNQRVPDYSSRGPSVHFFLRSLSEMVISSPSSKLSEDRVVALARMRPLCVSFCLPMGRPTAFFKRVQKGSTSARVGRSGGRGVRRRVRGRLLR